MSYRDASVTEEVRRAATFHPGQNGSRAQSLTPAHWSNRSARADRQPTSFATLDPSIFQGGGSRWPGRCSRGNSTSRTPQLIRCARFRTREFGHRGSTAGCGRNGAWSTLSRRSNRALPGARFWTPPHKSLRSRRLRHFGDARGRVDLSDRGRALPGTARERPGAPGPALGGRGRGDRTARYRARVSGHRDLSLRSRRLRHLEDAVAAIESRVTGRACSDTATRACQVADSGTSQTGSRPRVRVLEDALIRTPRQSPMENPGSALRGRR